jgi:cbb3-type cytochrome oxidase maturation protein
MEVLFVLIGLSLMVAIFFLVLFLRSVNEGQYDDMTTPSIRILFDDEAHLKKSKSNGSRESSN